MDLRAAQAPLKERYREDPTASRITLTARVGFEEIRLRFEIDAPKAGDEELASLHQKAERYCTVLQTLSESPRIKTELKAG